MEPDRSASSRMALGGVLIAAALSTGWFGHPSPVLAAVGAAGGTLFGLGLVHWLRSGSKEERRTKRLRVIQATGGAVAVAALGFALYVYAYVDTVRLCHASDASSDLSSRYAKRREAIERWKWYGAIIHKQFPCSTVDLDRYRREGSCPQVVHRSMSCVCGSTRWPSDSTCGETAMCASFGQLRDEIRCMSHACFERLTGGVHPDITKVVTDEIHTFYWCKELDR